MNGKVFREPARLGQARFKVQMPFRQRAAEFARDKNRVARFRATAQNLPAARHRSQQRDGNQKTAGIRRRLAADDGHAGFFCERVQAVVDFFHERRFETFGQRNRHERGGRRPGHRRDVAQAAGERLAPDFFRRRFPGEMNSLNHRVGLEQNQFFRHAQIQHGAVVARAGHDGFVRRQRFHQARDEFQLVHFSNWACRNFCSQRFICGRKCSVTRLVALNSECATTGASRQPVFS